MQICTSPQTDNHANIPSLRFLQAGCPSCHPTNSIKALKARIKQLLIIKISIKITSLVMDYKLQHQFHISDFFAQLDTLSTKDDLH